MAKKQEHRIEPQEYSRVLGTLELGEISIDKGSFNITREHFDGSLTLDIKDNCDFIETDDGIEVTVSYTLLGKSNAKKTAIRIKADFLLTYATPETITEDFFEVFQNVSLPFIIWPFFREYVYSITSRMYIPPLTLPQIRQ